MMSAQRQISKQAWEEISPVARAFSKAARHYRQFCQPQQEIVHYLIQALQENASPLYQDCLDVGAGPALYLDHLQQVAGFSKSVLTDLSFGMMREFNQSFSGYTHKYSVFPVCASGQSLPFQDESFDLVFSNMALQWFDQPEKFFQESLRLLKPNGTLCASAVITPSLYELDDALWCLGRTNSVNAFLTAGDYQKYFTGFQLQWHQVKTFVYSYFSVLDLLKSIKGVGAQTKLHRLGARYDAGLSKVWIHNLAEHYTQSAEGYPMSYCIYFFLLTKK